MLLHHLPVLYSDMVILFRKAQNLRVVNPVTEDTRGLFSGHWKLLKYTGYDCGRMNTRKDE